MKIIRLLAIEAALGVLTTENIGITADGTTVSGDVISFGCLGY